MGWEERHKKAFKTNSACLPGSLPLQLGLRKPPWLPGSRDKGVAQPEGDAGRGWRAVLCNTPRRRRRVRLGDSALENQ